MTQALTLTVTPGGVSDAAPDVSFNTGGPAPTRLGNLWRASGRGLGLILLRHFGCPFCKEHAHEIGQREQAFAELAVSIVMIGPGTPDEAEMFREEQNLANPVLSDHERTVYRAFGLGQASARSLLSRQVLIGGVRAAMKGYLPKRSAGNPLQLQGQFLIDREGIIRSADRPQRMSEIPSASALLADARQLAVPEGAIAPAA